MADKRGRPCLSVSERKKRKSDRNKVASLTRITLGEVYPRWQAAYSNSTATTHPEFAEILLECFENAGKEVFVSPVTSSTPAIQKIIRTHDLHSSLEREQEMQDSEMSEPPEIMSESIGEESRYSSSFVDPFQITVDFSDDEELEEFDEEYEPSFNITLDVDQSIPETTFEECELTLTDQQTPVTYKTYSTTFSQSIIQQQVFLTYYDQLEELAKIVIPSYCDKCLGKISSSKSTVGSALYIKWVCESGHEIKKWCSQPLLNMRLHAGDLHASAAILLSGNNYAKIALFAKALNAALPCASTFFRVQRKYLIPSVQEYYFQQQTSILLDSKDKELVILGDGRMDSPGFCAQYCSYIMMCNETKRILSLVTIDKRETAKSSAGLEKEGFYRALREVQATCKVSEIVTDAHIQIGAIMKRDYPTVKHSHDLWHAAKNLGKKIIAAGQQKSCGLLKSWSSHIVNHFYHVAGTANTYEEFVSMWFGVLHHVVDEHEWMLPYTGDNAECSHGPLEVHDTEWMTKGSPAHNELRNIVADRRFLQKVPYYLNARSTAELENFNSLLLMYAGKRFAYCPPVYRTRNQLAVIDYNFHLDRAVLFNKDGSQRLQRLFNKKSSRWTVIPVKQPKTYIYFKPLLQSIFERRLVDTEGMHGKAELEATDRRRLSANLARIPPPPTKDIMEEKRARVAKSKQDLEPPNSRKVVESQVKEMAVVVEAASARKVEESQVKDMEVVIEVEDPEAPSSTNFEEENGGQGNGTDVVVNAQSARKFEQEHSQGNGTEVVVEDKVYHKDASIANETTENSCGSGEDFNPNAIAIRVRDFVIIDVPAGKRFIPYLAQVNQLDGLSATVRFLRKSRGGWTFPDIEDISEEDLNDCRPVQVILESRHFRIVE